MPENRQVMIASVPQGPLRVEDFEVASATIPRPGEGRVLCKTLALTIGAGQRAGLQGSASYAGAPKAGVVMGGTGVARVEDSNSDTFRPGDLVIGPTGWQEYCGKTHGSCGHPTGCRSRAAPGVLGTNGLTAYFGLLEVGQPRPGETVVVSAAAGSVGHIVGRLRSCRIAASLELLGLTRSAQRWWTTSGSTSP
jgi:NADPH-dependent curcumin reductase CurA